MGKFLPLFLPDLCWAGRCDIYRNFPNFNEVFRERGVNLFWTIRACKGKRVLTASQKSAESVSCPQKQHISASQVRAASGQIDPALEGLTSFINNSLRLTEATRRICGMADLVCPSRLTRIQPQLLSVNYGETENERWLSLLIIVTG